MPDCRATSLTAILLWLGITSIIYAGRASAASAQRVWLPHTGNGSRFDDMIDVPSPYRLPVPAAPSGTRALINPANQTLTERRYGEPSGRVSDHDAGGTLSADAGDGRVFVGGYQDAAVVAWSPRSGRAVALDKAGSGGEVSDARVVGPAWT